MVAEKFNMRYDSIRFKWAYYSTQDCPGKHLNLSRFHQSGFIMDFVLKVSDVANGALVLLIKEQLVNA